MKKTTMVMAALMVANLASAQVKEVKVKSKISNVTLYRSQAMVSREVKVNSETGELAIQIDNLPSSIDPGSLFATSDDLKIRSVRYLTEYITDEKEKGKVTELRKRIEAIELLKKKILPERALLNSKKRFIDQLEAKYIKELGPSSTRLTDKDVKVSGFDFKTIEQMTEFIFKRQQDITTQTMALDDKERKLNDDIKKIAEEINAQLHDSSVSTTNSQRRQGVSDTKVLRKAVVYAAKKNAKPAKLILNYLVNNASWRPTYNMRINGNDNKLAVEYLAHVTQLSGEDWNGVKLKLSTATPNMNAEIPILAPMWTRLVPSEDLAKSMNAIQGSNKNRLLDNWKGRSQINKNFQKAVSVDNIQFNYDVNNNATDQQQLEFINPKQVLKRWYSEMRKTGGQIAVEYSIPDTITLASRKDNQMVQILSTSLTCNLYYEAVPLLADYVSRGIEAQNTLKQPLLAGRYSAYIDGQYVGAGNLPMTVTGQTLALGFGIDPQLKCRRELLDKTGDKSWGSRIENYTYKFTVDNYKSKAVNIRLLDRIPVTKDKGLKITLKTGKKELSKDADYMKFENPKGILRWDMELAPSTSGSNATSFEYSFDMKFDSDMQISTQGEEVRQEMQNDLMELRMQKFNF